MQGQPMQHLCLEPNQQGLKAVEARAGVFNDGSVFKECFIKIDIPLLTIPVPHFWRGRPRPCLLSSGLWPLLLIFRKIPSFSALVLM